MPDQSPASSTGSATNDPATVERLRVALRNDVHHLVQPIIGSLRMYSEGGYEAPDRESVGHLVKRLYAVLAVVDAIGDDDAHAAMAGQYGLGYAVTPEQEARDTATFRRILGGES